MRTHTLRWPALLLAAALAVYGCGDEATGPDGSLISESESTAFAIDFVNAAIAAYNSGTAGSPSASLFANVPLNFQYAHTQACSLGGTISVSGSLTGSISDDGSGTAFLQLLETINDCALEFREDGQITVNGNPSLSLTGTFSFLNFQPATQQTVRVGGGFNWDAEPGADGFCAVSLTINLATSASGTTTVSGTVCGHQVNLSS